MDQDESTRRIALPQLPLFAKPQQLASQSSSERELKRRRLGSTTGQDPTEDSQIRDAKELKTYGSQDAYVRLRNSLKPDLVNISLDSIEDVKKRLEEDDRFTQMFGPPTGSNATRDIRMPGSDSFGNNYDLDFPGYSRGRTPQRVEHTHHSPQTRPVSRSGSASSARSMIDERLEWAHQDRMRSASRDRSAPPSPFHEHSPFYAEFAGYTRPASPSNDDKPCKTTAANITQGPKTQSHKCSRINPSTGKPCNTVFSRPYDLKRHEDDLHEDRDVRFRCPHCHEGKSYRRKDTFIRHIAAQHPGLSTRVWSCAALEDPGAAIVRDARGLGVCGYCGMDLASPHVDEVFLAHLTSDHKFGKCEKPKRLSAVAFRVHLLHSHGARPDPWLHRLADACIEDISPTQDCISSAEANPRFSSDDAVPSKPSIPQKAVPAKACAHCRVKKIRCDGLRPCAACIWYECAEACADWNPDGTAAPNTYPSLSYGESKSFDQLPNMARTSSMGPTDAHGPPILSASGPSHLVEELAASPSVQIGLPSAAEAEKPGPLFECSTCQRSFARRTILVNHERTHTGEKPFSCTFEGCTQIFAQQGDKTRHEQAQHTEKTFRCGSLHSESPTWGCGKKFRRKDGLLEHHSKTKKGKQCVADRDKLMELGSIGDEDNPAFS